MKTDKRKIGSQDLESMTAEFLARGGQVSRHPPGGAENVVYKNRFRGRARPAKPEGGSNGDGGTAA
jgi:hypothetical protein